MTMEMHLEAVREGPLAAGRDVLVVGEDNPRTAAPKFSLYPLPLGCAGHRLCSKIMRLPFEHYVSLWRTNLCSQRWSIREARVRALILGREGTPWTHVILLGRRVAQGFRHPTRPWFSTWEQGDKRYLLIPHPSGRSREWNNSRNFDHAAEALKAFAPHIPWWTAVAATSTKRSKVS